MILRLDPRAKLYLLLLANLTLFFHVSLAAEITLVCLYLFLYFLGGKYKTGIKMLLIYGFLVGIDVFVIPVAEGVFLNVLSLASVGIRMLLPCIISGGYAFSTTTVGEMVCAMRKLYVPESITIPCVTVIRFFPTIAEDYRQIRNAMTLRGVSSKKPLALLEYILMPLLMNSNNVAQDISIAAMTKGISIPGRHTSMIELKMCWHDWGYMLLCTGPFLLFWGGVF